MLPQSIYGGYQPTEEEQERNLLIDVLGAGAATAGAGAAAYGIESERRARAGNQSRSSARSDINNDIAAAVRVLTNRSPQDKAGVDKGYRSIRDFGDQVRETYAEPTADKPTSIEDKISGLKKKLNIDSLGQVKGPDVSYYSLSNSDSKGYVKNPLTQYVCCPPDSDMKQLHIDPPAYRRKAEGMAGYLRFEGRISDSVLESITRQGQIYDQKEKALIQAKEDLKSELN